MSTGTIVVGTNKLLAKNIWELWAGKDYDHRGDHHSFSSRLQRQIWLRLFWWLFISLYKKCHYWKHLYTLSPWMHFGNLQDLFKTQVEWITEGFHFLYKKKIFLVQPRRIVWALFETLIRLIGLKHSTNYSKFNFEKPKSKAKILYALIALCYLTGADLFIAFASPVWGWVDEALVHGASSNWTQALMDDDRSVLGHTWLPSTAESTLGWSAASSSSVRKRSWNSPFALWFSSEDVSEELKHFTGGSPVLPKIETT